MERRKRDSSVGIGKLPALAPLANPYVPFQADGAEQYEAMHGLVRGTLYPGLDLPFLGKENKKPMTISPFSELQALAFAVQELALYLDTHQDDQEAYELYTQYQTILETKNKEYVKKRGPLCHKDITHHKEYNWLKDPWPWEYAGNQEV